MRTSGPVRAPLGDSLPPEQIGPNSRAAALILSAVSVLSFLIFVASVVIDWILW